MNWYDEILAARARIRTRIRKTPVARMELPGLDYPVQFKLEHMQHTGSFKVRGALNTLLTTEVPSAGLVAASGGNHGAAVAYAAQVMGHKAKIFVPEMAGPSKIGLIERLGADLTVVLGEYANAMEAAETWARESGAMQIHAYDAVPTIAGQGTCFAEWERQGFEADTLLIAVGGGGLISGAMGWFGGYKKIVAVEPFGCPSLCEALNIGAPVDVEVSGITANALGARRVGDLCFELANEQRLTSVLVSDDDVHAAQIKLWQELRQWVEPAGATALAALLSGAYEPEKEEKVAVLVCGANPDPDPVI